ncbi:MAG: type I restriction enzyme S subunit [Oleispira sp.]|jgi:type I restriction enzyme S subunit
MSDSIAPLVNNSIYDPGVVADYVAILKSGLSRRIQAQDIGVPVLISGNIKENRLDVSELKYWYLNDPQGARVENYYLDNGDILLCFINSPDQIGKLCIYQDIGRPVIYTTNLFRIKCKPNHDSVFLYYLLASDYIQYWIKRITKPAVNQASFTTGDFLGIPVNIFVDINEQQKIAKILTTVDNLIEKTQALIDKYTAIKQGMMADLFTRGIDLSGTSDTNPCHGQLRPPYEQAPELYKETELGWVPKEWEVYTFGDLADYKNGSSFSADDWKEEGLPIIRIQNLNGSGEYNYYQGEVKESWHILSGDLLFAWSGQKGVSFGARLWSRHEGVLNQHIFKVYENKKLLSRKFLYYLFKINVGRIEDNAHGFKDSFVHVTRSELTDVAIMLPTLCEQKIIEGRVLALDNSLSIEKRSLKKFGKLKKGLMQDLLTGKVQVDE